MIEKITYKRKNKSQHGYSRPNFEVKVIEIEVSIFAGSAETNSLDDMSGAYW